MKKKTTQTDPYEGLSDALRAKHFLQNMPVHSSYEPVPGIPIPNYDGILIKPLNNSGIEMLESGLLVSTNAANSIKMLSGVVYAIGPGCPDFIRVGTRWQFRDANPQSPYVVYRHKGIEYTAITMEAMLFALPDENTTIYGGVRTEKAMGRIKRTERQKTAFKADKIRDDDFKNKVSDKTKGKIRPVR